VGLVPSWLNTTKGDSISSTAGIQVWAHSLLLMRTHYDQSRSKKLCFADSLFYWDHSGYTSEQGIHLLPQFLPRVQQSASTPSKIQFLTIFYGANDACLSPSLQHVELDRYEQNIRTLIHTVHSPTSPTYSPGTRIILICPGPVEESLWAHRRKGQGRPMDRDKDVTKQYAALCLKVGQEYQAKNAQQASPQHHQVDVIDTWGLITAQVENGQQALSDYLRDGVHFTSEANDVRKQKKALLDSIFFSLTIKLLSNTCFCCRGCCAACFQAHHGDHPKTLPRVGSRKDGNACTLVCRPGLGASRDGSVALCEQGQLRRSRFWKEK